MPELQLYGDIGEDWYGEGITAKTVSAWLKANAEGVSEITVRMNSYGGWVSEGVAIYNLLSSHKARVIGIVDGFALSAMSVVAMGCDEIQMQPGSIMMIHPASGMAWGTAEDLESTAKGLRAMSTSIAGIYSERTGKTVEECMALMDEETWMSAAEAVSMAFADKVLPGKKRASNSASASVAPSTPATAKWVAAYKKVPTAIQPALNALASAARERFEPVRTPAADPPAETPPSAPAAQSTTPFRAARSPLGELAARAHARIGDL